MYEEPKTLIVVYKDKDEMALNLLRMLVERKDDISESGKIVGTEDGTVSILSWNEKTWLDNKKAGNINSKILFIGDIKGVENLIPIINVKYNKFGITYGWAGSQFILIVDDKTLKQKDDYDVFIKELKAKTDISIASKEKKIGINKKTLLKLGGAQIPLVWPIFSGSIIKDFYDDKVLIRKQQFLLGVTELYMKDLDQFMKE